MIHPTSNVIQINRIQHHNFQLQKRGFRDFSIQIELDLVKVYVSEQTQYFIQKYHIQHLFNLNSKLEKLLKKLESWNPCPQQK